MSEFVRLVDASGKMPPGGQTLNLDQALIDECKGRIERAIAPAQVPLVLGALGGMLAETQKNPSSHDPWLSFLNPWGAAVAVVVIPNPRHPPPLSWP